MHFPKFSTFIGKGLSIIAAFFGFEAEPSKITCPSSQRINERIAIKNPLSFQVFTIVVTITELSKTTPGIL